MMQRRPVILEPKSNFDPVSIAVGVGTLLGSVFGKKKKQAPAGASKEELTLARAQLAAQVARDKQNNQLIFFAVLAAVSIILMILIFKSKR